MINNKRFQSSVYEDQSSSSCSECKKHNPNSNSNNYSYQHNHPHASLSSDEEVENILRTNINQNNNIFQRTLEMLRIQIQQLKKQNKVKDKLIDDLQFHFKLSKRDEYIKKQIERKSLQNQYKHRNIMGLGYSPRNSQNYQSNQAIRYNYQGNGYSNVQHYEAQQENRFPGYLGNKMNYNMSSPRNQLNHHQVNKNHYENTENLKIKLLQEQIKGYQQQLLKMQKIFTSLESQNVWHIKFINNFVKMCEQLSVNYGQKLILKKYDQNAKKQTKICWIYMKKLVSYFISEIKQKQMALKQITQLLNKQHEDTQQFLKKYI